MCCIVQPDTTQVDSPACELAAVGGAVCVSSWAFISSSTSNPAKHTINIVHPYALSFKTRQRKPCSAVTGHLTPTASTAQCPLQPWTYAELVMHSVYHCLLSQPQRQWFTIDAVSRVCVAAKQHGRALQPNARTHHRPAEHQGSCCALASHGCCLSVHLTALQLRPSAAWHSSLPSQAHSLRSTTQQGLPCDVSLLY